MELEFKPDFEEARARWTRYWKGECFDRPPLGIVLPKDGIQPVALPKPYHLPHADLDQVADQLIAWAGSYEWLAEAIPGYPVTFAPDHFALLLGADLREDGEWADESTAWVMPFLDDYDQEIRFQPEGRWWAKTVECVRKLRQRCDGKLLISWTHFQGGLDALSAIRTPQKLLEDLILCPDDVKRALRQIDQAIDDARRAFAQELDAATWGTWTRHGMYSTGLVDIPQCDFSAMIGPDMFREFGLPSLAHECDMLDAAEYHLDGPDAIKHLPAIAEIKAIHLIQWQPGAGAAAVKDWTDLYRQIDQLGLGQIRQGTRQQALDLWQHVQCRERLFVSSVTDIHTRSEADAFLARF